MAEQRDIISMFIGRRAPVELLFIIGAALVAFALTAGLNSDRFIVLLVTLTGIALLLTGAAFTLLSYLQDVRRRTLSSDALQSEEYKILANRLDKIIIPDAVVSDDERTALIDSIRKSLTNDTRKQLADTWAAEFQGRFQNQTDTNALLSRSNDIVRRLQNEIDALGRRANVNLVIGILISALGIGLLTWFVIQSTDELAKGLSAGDAAMRFAVRLSVALFVQVFAYFFLRLYRYSIFEIKYFQNEITGAEFRILAIVSSLHQKDGKIPEKLVLELAKTERNFILKKGETTVGIQRDMIERDYEAQIGKIVEAAIERKGK
jgi:hypothetical protein